MEQELASPKKNKVWINIVIALLTFATVGQFVAVFSTAIAKLPQDPEDLTASVLLPGLLFMSIWALKNKRKLTGFIIGAVIGLLVQFSAGFITGYLQANDRNIDKEIAVINKGLPKMIDKDFRIDSVTVDHKTKLFSFNATIVDYLKSDLNIGVFSKNFDKVMKPAICKKADMQIFFRGGYTIQYVYKDKNGELINKYNISPFDCK